MRSGDTRATQPPGGGEDRRRPRLTVHPKHAHVARIEGETDRPLRKRKHQSVHSVTHSSAGPEVGSGSRPSDSGPTLPSSRSKPAGYAPQPSPTGASHNPMTGNHTYKALSFHITTAPTDSKRCLCLYLSDSATPSSTLRCGRSLERERSAYPELVVVALALPAVYASARRSVERAGGHPAQDRQPDAARLGGAAVHPHGALEAPVLPCRRGDPPPPASPPPTCPDARLPPGPKRVPPRSQPPTALQAPAHGTVTVSKRSDEPSGRTDGRKANPPMKRRACSRAGEESEQQ
ncbi:hypothetical protein SKAU_G00133220 [Synaphobranchus kaupii]|uniref:Uncharacterized protein n=1 Tax=Synaphobranchus kaupii TaxID=118154 RepID=A0A9Q1J381_SYNKA|nr:hypothetical protein SKAU_G00133220 [Synaphobranchus kaupii]